MPWFCQVTHLLWSPHWGEVAPLLADGTIPTRTPAMHGSKMQRFLNFQTLAFLTKKISRAKSKYWNGLIFFWNVSFAISSWTALRLARVYSGGRNSPFLTPPSADFRIRWKVGSGLCPQGQLGEENKGALQIWTRLNREQKSSRKFLHVGQMVLKPTSLNFGRINILKHGLGERLHGLQLC